MPGKGEQDESPTDLSQFVEGAFETHEEELFEKFMRLVQRGISEDATVREAKAEMQRAAREDPEAIELLLRLATMRHFGGTVVDDRLNGRGE